MRIASKKELASLPPQIFEWRENFCKSQQSYRKMSPMVFLSVYMHGGVMLVKFQAGVLVDFNRGGDARYINFVQNKKILDIIHILKDTFFT